MTLRELAGQEAPRWAIWPLVLVLLACAGAGVAQWVDPPVVVEREVELRLVTRTREVVRWRTATNTTTRTVITPVLLHVPDGGVLLAASTLTETRELTRSSGGSETETQRDEARRELMTVTPAAPRWRASLQVGATWAQPAVPLAGPLVLGLGIETRLPLPLPAPYSVWAGAWGGTYSAVGGSLSLEF